MWMHAKILMPRGMCRFFPAANNLRRMKQGIFFALLCGSITNAFALEFPARPATQEIVRARIFEEPLVPVGGEPTSDENAALAAALVEYSRRGMADDFSSLTRFLEGHTHSPWKAALL